jgi:thioredoxin-like negative regulator of GroEL
MTRLIPRGLYYWLAAGLIAVGAGVAVFRLGIGPAAPTAGLSDAKHLMMTHQRSAAAQVLATALARDPDNPAALSLIADFYGEIRDPASGLPIAGDAQASVKAITVVLGEIVSRHPGSPDTLLLLGEYELASRHDEAAAASLIRAIKAGAPTAQALVPLSLALLRSEQSEKLIDLLDPNDAVGVADRGQALRARALAQLLLGQVDDARASFVAILWRDPDNLEAKMRLGLLELRQGDRNAARYWVEETRKAAASAPASLALAGEYGQATHDYAASAAAFGDLAERPMPDMFGLTEPHLGRARALIYLGDLAGAASALDAAPFPRDDPHVKYYRALLAYRSGAFDRAAELAEGLETRMPHFPPLNLLMAGTMLATGYTETAAWHLRRYLAAVPGDADAAALMDLTEQRLMKPRTNEPVRTTLLFSVLGFETGPALEGSGKF